MLLTPVLSSPSPSPLHSLPSVPTGSCPPLVPCPFLSSLCGSPLFSTPFSLPLNVLISEEVLDGFLRPCHYSVGVQRGLRT